MENSIDISAIDRAIAAAKARLASAAEVIETTDSETSEVAETTSVPADKKLTKEEKAAIREQKRLQREKERAERQAKRSETIVKKSTNKLLPLDEATSAAYDSLLSLDATQTAALIVHLQHRIRTLKVESGGGDATFNVGDRVKILNDPKHAGKFATVTAVGRIRVLMKTDDGKTAYTFKTDVEAA